MTLKQLFTILEKGNVDGDYAVEVKGYCRVHVYFRKGKIDHYTDGMYTIHEGLLTQVLRHTIVVDYGDFNTIIVELPKELRD